MNIYLILLFCLYASIAIYNRLTYTEGWYTEGWYPFFKKLLTGKLKYS